MYTRLYIDCTNRGNFCRTSHYRHCNGMPRANNNTIHHGHRGRLEQL